MTLIPVYPLDQVLFVQDYVQLRFHDEGFSLYASVHLVVDGKKMHRTETGFCDCLVSFIGQRVVEQRNYEDNSLELIFGNGALVGVTPLAELDETWMFVDGTGTIVIGRDA